MINQKEKAIYSSLAPKPVDYEIDFVDFQRLQKLVDTLSLAREILKSVERIAYTIRSKENDLRLLEHTKNDFDSHRLCRISGYIKRLQGFTRTAAALGRQAESISLLVSCVIMVESVAFTCLFSCRSC